MESLKKHKKIITGILLIIGIISTSLIYYLYQDEPNNSVVYAKDEVTTNETHGQESKSFYVDIKGSVKKPGVYLVSDANIVQDVINFAGGLKSGASTNNINLSEKVKEEMVIYIFSKKELKDSNQTNLSTTTCTTNVIEVNKCEPFTKPNDVNTKTTQSSLVNINTASKEELMSIPNIGASKADAIIIYRAETKFNTIEDIMNVSGIGESVFVKIKDFITV